MIEFRPLRAQELDLWYAHCRSVFESEEAGYFRRHFELDPDADASLIFVAMDGDTIAATVRVFDRRIFLRGRAVRAGGIGEVSAKPAYRRQGLTTRLLDMAVQAMEERGMAVSLLFGEAPLYARALWRFCPIRRTDVIAASLPSDLGGGTLRSFVPEDLPFLMGLYDLFAGRLDGAVIRSEAYWKRWVLPQWQPPSVLEIDGRPAAYACARLAADGRLHVGELCAAPQAEKLVPGFVLALMERSGTQRARLLIPLPGMDGEDAAASNLLMVRLNAPMEGIPDSDALADAMRPRVGIFEVDMF